MVLAVLQILDSSFHRLACKAFRSCFNFLKSAATVDCAMAFGRVNQGVGTPTQGKLVGQSEELVDRGGTSDNPGV